MAFGGGSLGVGNCARDNALQGVMPGGGIIDDSAVDQTLDMGMVPAAVKDTPLAAVIQAAISAPGAENSGLADLQQDHCGAQAPARRMPLTVPGEARLGSLDCSIDPYWSGGRLTGKFFGDNAAAQPAGCSAAGRAAHPVA